MAAAEGLLRDVRMLGAMPQQLGRSLVGPVPAWQEINPDVLDEFASKNTAKWSNKAGQTTARWMHDLALWTGQWSVYRRKKALKRRR